MAFRAILPFYLCQAGLGVSSKTERKPTLPGERRHPVRKMEKHQQLLGATAMGVNFQSPPRHQARHDTDRSLPDTEHRKAW